MSYDLIFNNREYILLYLIFILRFHNQENSQKLVRFMTYELSLSLNYAYY